MELLENLGLTLKVSQASLTDLTLLPMIFQIRPDLTFYMMEDQPVSDGFFSLEL